MLMYVEKRKVQRPLSHSMRVPGGLSVYSSHSSCVPTGHQKPRGHPFKNLKAWTCLLYPNSRIKPVLRPTEEYSHSTHTRHRVDASHFQHNPPLRLHTSQAISKAILASLIDHDSLQPDIRTLYIFEQFTLYIFRVVYNCIW